MLSDLLSSRASGSVGDSVSKIRWLLIEVKALCQPLTSKYMNTFFWTKHIPTTKVSLLLPARPNVSLGDISSRLQAWAVGTCAAGSERPSGLHIDLYISRGHKGSS